MKKKSTVSPALWFIPLLAICMALLFTLVFVTGKFFLKKSSLASKPAQAVAVQQPTAVPVVPLASLEEVTAEEETIPAEVLEQTEDLIQELPPQAEPAEPEVCPAPSVPVKIKKPQRRAPATPFEQGLRQCKQGGMFPCAWADDSRGVRTQYWLMSAGGPIQRGVYDMGGDLINETIATVGGTVMSYTDKTTAWYFEAGALIKIRTSPYDNCNLHDWFFIDGNGRQDVCQCAHSQPDCCARSPYREGMGFSYCELFPLDQDFCHK